MSGSGNSVFKYSDAFAAELKRQQDEPGWKDWVKSVNSYKNPLRDIREPRKVGGEKAEQSVKEQERKGYFTTKERSFDRLKPREGKIEVTVFEPTSDIPHAQRPCIAFFHGGAFAGSNRFVGPHTNAERWVRALGAVIVSVEYGRTPENSGDGLAKDCYEGLRWLWKKSGIEFDRQKLLLYGASAGGTLALGAALMHNKLDDPDKPKLCGVFLEAAPLNPRCDTASMKRLWAPKPFLNGELCDEMWRAMQPENHKEGDRYNKYMAPIDATDQELAELPPIAADVGNMDPTCDDLISFFQRLGMRRLANVQGSVSLTSFKSPNGKDCHFRLVDGVPHAYWVILPEEEVSKGFERFRVRWMGERFGVSPQA